MRLLGSGKMVGFLAALNVLAILIIIFVSIPEKEIIMDDPRPSKAGTKERESQSSVGQVSVSKDKPSKEEQDSQGTEDSKEQASQEAEHSKEQVTEGAGNVYAFQWFDDIHLADGSLYVRLDDAAMQKPSAWAGEWECVMYLISEDQEQREILCNVTLEPSEQGTCKCSIQCLKEKVPGLDEWFDISYFGAIVYNGVHDDYGMHANESQSIYVGPFWHEGGMQYGVGSLESGDGIKRELGLMRSMEGN